MDEEFLDLLTDADPDAILAAINKLGSEEVVNPASTTGAESGASATTADTAANTGAEVETPAGIASKNGEHVIPFSVLEEERRQNAELRRQLAEHDRNVETSQSASADYEAMQRRNELLRAQLEAQGIKPAELPEEQTLTADELQQLEEFGEIGEVTGKVGHKVLQILDTQKKMQEQLAALTKAPATQAPAETTDPAVTAVSAAIAATPGLPEVMADPALSKLAVDIDNQLKTNPAFANKSIKERFAEVMRQMTPRLVKQDASKAPQKDVDTEAPFSLSGIPGATNDVTASIADRLSHMNEAQIQTYIETASPAEVQEILRAMGH